MIPVLTKEQAYQLDKVTIESGHLSQEELMDNAGKSIAQFFCEKIDNPFNQKVVVVCGKGNNGGDGIIAHSYLKYYGVSSKIVITEEKHGHSKLFKKYKIPKSEYSIYNDKTKFDKYDWIIDGIFGIGLSRELDRKYNNILDDINSSNKIISIDVPSGLNDFTDKNGYKINSLYTVTFNYLKVVHFMNPTNNIVISNIGIKNLDNDKVILSKIVLNDIKKILHPIRFKNYKHKKTTECTIHAGSYKYPGAAYLSSMAARKTGSGYVNLYTPLINKASNLIENLKTLMPEIIVHDEEELKHTYFRDDRANPVLIGPGGTTLDDFDSMVKCQDGGAYQRIVIDASAIPSNNNNANNDDTLEDNVLQTPEFSIITPHIGEFRKFIRLDKFKNIEFSHIQDMQKKIGYRIMILKSFNTFIITKDMIYIMDRGPSLLATAGTGDVLSGILVSLLSQGYSRLETSIVGTYLHAEAANYYMNNISKDGMTASDLMNCIPHAFNILRNNE